MTVTSIVLLILWGCAHAFHLGGSLERAVLLHMQSHSEQCEVNSALMKTATAETAAPIPVESTILHVDTQVDCVPVLSALYAPPPLQEYLEGGVLSDTHKVKVDHWFTIVTSRVDAKSMRDQDHQRVLEALTMLYLVASVRKGCDGTRDELALAAGRACVLVELGADADTVLAGILQAVISDVPTSLHAEISRRLGSASVNLALLYRTLSLHSGDADLLACDGLEAENRLQMLVSLADDYRALYIAVAERLYTMRGLRKRGVGPSSMRRIALEARHITAPLAHKMGLMQAHAELEDAAFRILEPEMFLRTRYTQTAAAKAYRDATQRVAQFLRGDSILQSRRAVLKLSHRIKSKYQLYLKMLRKGLNSPNDVRDALGLRVVVDYPACRNQSTSSPDQSATALCYYVVQGLRQLPGWEHARGGFKDYILHPKSNGYQSLHQYIRHLALGVNVEVQVRSRQQHRVAEVGGAAHWSYKDSIYRPEVARSEEYRRAWRSPAQLRARTPEEVFALARQQLRAERVSVWWTGTGAGEARVLNVPRDCTVADVAAQVGVPVEQLLLNGEQMDPVAVLQIGDRLSTKLCGGDDGAGGGV